MKRTLFVLFALAALAIAAADAPQPRLIDFNPWSWIPSNRNKSPSIMDYFFPPSRTPKQSNIEPPADRQPPASTVDDQTLTNLEERPTTLGRKSHNKNKVTIPTVRHTTTNYPKTKKSSHKHIATDTTLDTKATSTSKIETTTLTPNILTTTVKPPKRYTIRTVRTTGTPPAQQTESTVNSDSTETVSGIETTGTTIEANKETSQTVTTIAERSTEGTISTGTDSTITDSTVTEPVDSREGYLPLRDKPQENNVKINEQTNKEVTLESGSYNGATAGGVDVGASQANQIPLLSTQSTHLFIAGMRNSTGVQRGVRALKLHAAAVRVPVALPGPVLGELERGRPAHNAPHHRLQKEVREESGDIGEDVRSRIRDEGVPGAEGLVPVGAAEHQNRQITLPGHMPVSGDTYPRRSDVPRPADIRLRPRHQSLRHDVCEIHHELLWFQYESLHRRRPEHHQHIQSRLFPTPLLSGQANIQSISNA